jgi:hypothetical protein
VAVAGKGDKTCRGHRRLVDRRLLALLEVAQQPALERGDVDRPNGVVHVRRVCVDGGIRLYGKQSRSLRAVPLPLRAAQALNELPPRLDTRLLFPGVRGGHLNLHKWRTVEWTPAVKAAGLVHRSPYALRHTFATFAIAAGVSLFELARFMGTSVEQIDRTYGHLLPIQSIGLGRRSMGLSYAKRLRRSVFSSSSRSRCSRSRGRSSRSHIRASRSSVSSGFLDCSANRSCPECAQPSRPRISARGAKTPRERGFLLIGAPRFELGTSSPPDFASGQASCVGKWRELVNVQGFQFSDEDRSSFPP